MNHSSSRSQMPTPRRRTSRRGDNSHDDQTPWWKLKAFFALLGIDALISVVFTIPWFPVINALENVNNQHYSLHGCLWDVGFLSLLRILVALVTLASGAYLPSLSDAQNDEDISLAVNDLYHPSGERKSKAELEAEALEEPYRVQCARFFRRRAVGGETLSVVTALWVAAKAMARLNVEIGVYNEAHDRHPWFWIVLAFTTATAWAEGLSLDSLQVLLEDWAQKRQRTTASVDMRRPLLSGRDAPSETQLGNTSSFRGDNEVVEDNMLDENVPGYSEIGADANYTATLSDLWKICQPDRYLILLASVFLIAGGMFQVFIPKLTGAILDALVQQDSDRPDQGWIGDPAWVTQSYYQSSRGGIARIPGFFRNIQLLLLVSILAGLCSGIRAMIFTMVGARVNTRLRIRLMDSLLSQEIGFFDTTRTGDITSRLSSDTTIVGNSITTNVNIFLRATVRALGVLIFMFTISWQLSMLAFLTIPAVSILSKWYGRYVRRLSKLQQKKLADGNSVSEATISSMATVRAFGSETVELGEFESCMENYLRLNSKAAVATMGYSTLVGALPQLVNALVLFYGGLLVQTDGEGHISGGQLVSFILYLSSLSEAFNSLGGIYASLVRLAGAADKVIELLNRETRVAQPSHVDEAKLGLALEKRNKHLLSVQSDRVVRQRAAGFYPETCEGEITFSNVEFRYPARPQRTVLKGMNLDIAPGSIVALVGASGGGKSSIVKLIQHLYEPIDGEVCIDGVPVKELSADWLCRNVAVVSQEPVLFARSVRRNIIYGLEGTEEEPGMEVIEEAARLANAADFINGLPKGYETEVGERGLQLSGGQKQRVAIARALVRKPKILLLDEATSALDSESEFIVQEAIDEMISGQRSLHVDSSRSMTVVIVAHRLSTIRNADCIFVVKDGQVVEQGSHDELIEVANGVYATLVERQLGQMSRSGSTTDL